MPRNIDLTEAEWTLMEQLWGAPGQTGRALTDALHAKTSWARSTTLTLLRRLTEKGAVRTEVQDGMHVYFPAVSREDAPRGRRATCLAVSTTGASACSSAP